MLLTPHQASILTLVAEGLTHEEIAAAKEISPHTVTRTLATIYDKLRARGGPHAVYIAIKAGEID